MKISSISESHTNLMDDKQDGILNYKTMILYYDISLGRQTQKLTFYQGRITSTLQKTIKMCRCSRRKCGQGDKLQQKSR